jgi:hypothetical protein
LKIFFNSKDYPLINEGAHNVKFPPKKMPHFNLIFVEGVLKRDFERTGLYEFPTPCEKG